MAWQRYNKNLRESALLAEYFSFWTKNKKHQERCALLRIAPDNQFRVLLFFVPDGVATRRIVFLIVLIVPVVPA